MRRLLETRTARPSQHPCQSAYAQHNHRYAGGAVGVNAAETKKDCFCPWYCCEMFFAGASSVGATENQSV